MKIQLLDIAEPDLLFRVIDGEKVLFMFKREDLPEAEPDVKVNRLNIPQEYEPYICSAVEDAYWANLPMSRPRLLSLINDNIPKSIPPLGVDAREENA